MASNHHKKTEKNTNDFRDSITVIRTGNAAGDQGPQIYLLKGKRMEVSTFKDLHRNHSAPQFSKIVMTPNAYLTDEAWLELVPNLCKGLRSMPVVKDHPDWWMICTCDGFSSHLVTGALETFSQHKIFLVQEDGMTSQTNQPYDQLVARLDKKELRCLLDLHRNNSKEQLNQYTIVAICLSVFKKIKKEVWIESFKKVNLHPKFRMNFNDWLKKIDSQIMTGEKFFKGRTSLYDAMPTLWRNMSVHERLELIEMIDGFKEKETSTEGIWEKKENILDLLKYAPLDQIPRLRACYLTAKQDPAVIHQVIEECTTEDYDPEDICHNFYDAGKLFPLNLLKEYKKSRSTPCDEKASHELLTHLTNRAARQHHSAHLRPGNFEPSKYLDLEIKEEQVHFLNPVVSELFLLSIEEDAYGKSATKKRNRRHQDFIDGNAKSYARVLNSSHRMEAVTEYNSLLTTLAGIRAENDEKKTERDNKKKEEQIQKEQKATEVKEAREAKRQDLLPGIREDIAKGEQYVLMLPNTRLKEILLYYFEVERSIVNKLTNKTQLQNEIRAKFTAV
jgi:hypothetical protein